MLDHSADLRISSSIQVHNIATKYSYVADMTQKIWAYLKLPIRKLKRHERARLSSPTGKSKRILLQLKLYRAKRR